MSEAYNHENPADRVSLACQIKQALPPSLWTLENKRGELVATHTLASGRVIQVWTSIHREVIGKSHADAVAVNGSDAIRVVALARKDGKLVPILPKAVRVNRTGEMSGIVTRMQALIKQVLADIRPLGKCSCGGMRALSKKGKPYCLELCFINKGKGVAQNAHR